MYLLYLPIHCVRVCVCKVQNEYVGAFVCVCQGISLTGEAPLTSLPFVQSLGDSHHQKSMCVWAYVCLCVCQGFVRQISPACTALVLLNQASITRPLWIMQGRLLLTYSTGCSHVRVCVCVTGWSFFLLANVTGQFFHVPPLGPLNPMSDTGTPTLILSLWVCAPHVCERKCVYAGGFYSRQEEINSSRQVRPALWHTLTHYIQPAQWNIVIKKDN